MKNQVLIIKMILIFILTPIFWPLVSLFTLVHIIRIILSLLSSAIIVPVFFSMYRYFERKYARQSLQLFTQVCLSHINMGDSLHVSMKQALDSLLVRTKFPYQKKSLRKAKLGLELHKDFQDNLPLLTELFPCPESQAFFLLLNNPSLMGKQVKSLFQGFERNLREILKREESIAAEKSKSLIESLSLLMMPVLIIFFLKNTAMEFYSNAFHNAQSQNLLLLAYALFIGSLIFIKRIFWPMEKIRRINNKKTKGPIKSNENNFLLLFFLRSKVERSLHHYDVTGNLKKDQIRYLQNKKRIRFFFYALILTGSTWINGLPAILSILIFFLIFLYPDYRLIENFKEYREQQIASLGQFFQYLILCLKSGMSVEYALATIEDNLGENFPLRPEIKRINLELLNQNSLDNSLNNFASNIDFPEVSMYLHLLKLHAYTGNREDLELLDLQNQQFQHILEEEAKKQIARKSNNYLVPMLMNLFAVMLISIAPILPYFQF